jgi:hypothetical protein
MAQISTVTEDNEGIAHLVGSEVLSIRYVDVAVSSFANPDYGYTGYSADGFYYTDGYPDPTVSPYKASWASEGEGEADLYRGTLDRFPSRIFVVTTSVEVVIIDADSLDVWMRFVPRGVPTAYNYGSLVGDSDSEIRDAAFVEGFLVVATSKGVRIADFRTDMMYALGEADGAYQSLTGTIASRNNDGIAEGGGAYGGGSEDILQDDCLCLDVGVVGPNVSATTGAFYVAAIGTTTGLVGVTILGPSVSAPRVMNHVHFLADGIGAWVVVDDGDGDGTTPYVEHNSDPTAWSTNNVRVGDVVRLLPVGTEVTVEAISSTGRLTVTPEIALASSGADCESERAVPAVHVRADGGLLFANGQQLLTWAVDGDWYYRVDGSDEGFADPRTSSGTALVILTHEEITQIRSVHWSGATAYAATDQGVFVATEDTFADSDGGSLAPAELRYAALGASLEATYSILEGAPVDCYDVVVDPETGNILVATVDVDEETCSVTEIDPSIHRAFQFFTESDFDGLVKTLVAFRNPSGPPDDESGVA